MKYSRILPAMLAISLLLPAAGFAERSQPERKVVAYYFYSNFRCPSCLTIEKLIENTLRSEFAGELFAGLLQWNPVNIQEEGNGHFVDDFRLYSKAVVLVSEEGGRAVKWKNLEKIWVFLGREDEFERYIKQEVARFLREL